MHAGGGQAGAYGSAQGIRDLLGGLWSTVAIQAPSAEERLAIVGCAFPQLAALLPAGLAALSLVKVAAGQQWDEDEVRSLLWCLARRVSACIPDLTCCCTALAGTGEA